MESKKNDQTKQKLIEKEKGIVSVKWIKRGRTWKGETKGWGSGNGRSGE